LKLAGVTVAAPYFWSFVLAYAAWILLAIGIVNGIMAYMRAQKGTPVN